MIICPRYLHLLTLGNVSPFSQRFGMCISLNLLQQYIITLLLALLYLISCSIPYSEHTDNSIDKPIDEGAMSTQSSAYIKWLINEEPIIHPAFTLFNLLLISSRQTQKKMRRNNSSLTHPVSNRKMIGHDIFPTYIHFLSSISKY